MPYALVSIGSPKKDSVAVYRATNLTAEQVKVIVCRRGRKTSGQEIWLSHDCRSFFRLAIRLAILGYVSFLAIDSW